MIGPGSVCLLLDYCNHAITPHIVVLKNVGQVNKCSATSQLVFKVNDSHIGADMSALDFTLTQVENLKELPQLILCESGAQFRLQILHQNLGFRFFPFLS